MKAVIYNAHWWLPQGNPDKRDYDQMLYASGFNVLRYVAHCFKPTGYTGLWLLSESHLALHSWPEHNKHYVELSSCNKKMYNTFLYLMEEKCKTS